MINKKLNSVKEITGVQEPTVRYARNLGWVAWKMKIEGRNGCPDFWFFRAGVMLIVEFKRPDGERRVQQELRARDLWNAGFKVHVIDNYQDAKALFDKYEVGGDL